ncbi:metalloregulator ArsR/SmtB family transcription factor [Croceicoccus sp. F390]|uniref:Metalloregulator ArsR/SmtB family transcription factor n=1 Tax=Croceicoccus esteveae TaxID=3075597 RepID=A0ABU2ZJD4_9SPHN|nr:metalloregulator ArsR/SmtB family transcription factor [Croceicoccus sp. F390]MDT0576716.1 metalloregulator ArsR/SmtB family transcription factor [Croceicoccus sp. F390]
MTLAELLRALDDPTRLRLLRLLSRMELAVGEIAEVLEQSQPRISRHIRILTEAGLVAKRKEGNWVFLRSRLNTGMHERPTTSSSGDQSGADRAGARQDAHDGIPPAASLHDTPAMLRAVDRLLAAAEREDSQFAFDCKTDRDRLNTVRATRETSAARYFAHHAAEWDSLRSLHIAEGAVEAELARLLCVTERAAGTTPLGDLLDIGTGTGRMAELFLPSSAHVAAIDKSPEMLRIARVRLQQVPPSRLALLQGDFRALPFTPMRFDTVLLHLVLHYAQDPETVLAEAARVTRTGGRIAIVDFAAHSREELRERHAHARLGFTDAQMQTLLTNAGFCPDADSALAGHELTVRIWIATRRPTVHTIAPMGEDDRKAAAR